MSTGKQPREPDAAAVAAAMAVLDEHIRALNARDEKALLATLHIPHFRLAGGSMQVWERPEGYLRDFYARTDAEWHHSAWDFRKVVAAEPEKVHLDVQFTRYRTDNSAISSYRSLWIVAKIKGRWAAQCRSSFAA